MLWRGRCISGLRVCRLDLINAIRDFGGYSDVADKMQWSVAKVTRRPRGYWGSLDNIQTEVDLFNDEFDLPMGTIPTKSFLRKMSRFDIIKALERGGGAVMVRTLLANILATAYRRWPACAHAGR